MRSSPFLFALLLAACPNGNTEADAEPPCAIGFVGDQDAAPEITLVVREGGMIDPLTGAGEGTMRPLLDGDPVPIVKPPQGGKVIFPGIRARNVDVCGTYIKSWLVDCEGHPLALDKRRTYFRVAEDGWA